MSIIEAYAFDADFENAEFFFESTGPRGVIQKRMKFYRLVEEGLIFYQAELADQRIDATGREVWDYKLRSGNSDAERILATVFNIIGAFLDNGLPLQNRVLIEGFDAGARNRLYKMFISKHFISLAEFMSVDIITLNKRLVPFDPDTDSYGFVVTLL
jgi:hypothetical protein